MMILTLELLDAARVLKYLVVNRNRVTGILKYCDKRNKMKDNQIKKHDKAMISKRQNLHILIGGAYVIPK